MQLVHITEDFVNSGGGLPVVIASHLSWQLETGWDVSLLQTATSNLLDSDSAHLVSCPSSRLGRAWRWSPELAGCIDNFISDGAELFHLHGIWTAPQAISSKLSYQSGIPSVISFHGQLLEGALGQGINPQALKKRLYFNLVGRRIVQRAKVLHAITRYEAESLRKLFPHSPIEVIPNFINTQLVASQLSGADYQAGKHGREILYLGRLDARKGVVLLLHAFVQAKLSDDWTLCIAGPDDTPGLRGELKRLIHMYQMDKRIRVIEPVYGKEKWKLLSHASLVCLPSFHEVIGMVNLEAALCSKVVLTTPNAGLEGWEEAGGVLVEPLVPEVSAALKEIASWSDYEMGSRGASLKAWVSNYYSLDRVRSQWVELYEEAAR